MGQWGPVRVDEIRERIAESRESWTEPETKQLADDCEALLRERDEAVAQESVLRTIAREAEQTVNRFGREIERLKAERNTLRAALEAVREVIPAPWHTYSLWHDAPRIVDAVNAHEGETPQLDDLTLVVLKRL